MASKRIIGVLAVKDGRLVKSYGYAAWRPAGDLVTALENFDRWAADEIVVLDISRRAGLDAGVLKQIAAAKIATPLSYGGGIRREQDVRRLMELGCDRFVVESLMFDDPVTLRRIADVAGQQALIGSVPLVRAGDDWKLWRPDGADGPGLGALRELLGRQPVAEFFVTAVGSEGRAGAFPLGLLEAFRDGAAHSVIWFGGLDEESASHCLCAEVTAAVAFGNPLHETELALPWLRQGLLASGGDEALRTVRSFST